MRVFLSKNWPLLALCFASIVVGVVGFGSLAQAQVVSSCYGLTVMDEPIQVCPGDGHYEVFNLSSGTIRVKIDMGTVDLATCRPESINGVTKARCSTGLYEWRRQNGLLSLRLIPEVSREEAPRLIYLDSAQQRSAVYGYVPPECGVVIERNTQRCDDARWRRRNVVHCYGPYMGTPVYEAETCIRWREQRRFGN